ncbi:MAG: class I SAM-dependent methyltransferase [Coleofasciculaceae cyanobacterium]
MVLAQLVINKAVKNSFAHLIMRKEIGRLYSHPEMEVAKPLIKALACTLNNLITPEERILIDKIESLRKELNESSREISIVDYGSQSPNNQLITEETESAQIVTKTIGEVCKICSKRPIWALLLFNLIREFKPSTCLEMGTCLGISAAYQSAGLEVNNRGKLLSLEGSSSLAQVAQNNLQKLGMTRAEIIVGKFQETLLRVAAEQSPLDFVFLDGHHDQQATLTYFDQLFPFLANNALCIFDDISWSIGMKKAWKTLVADERIKLAVDLHNVGICVVAR